MLDLFVFILLPTCLFFFIYSCLSNLSSICLWHWRHSNSHQSNHSKELTLVEHLLHVTYFLSLSSSPLICALTLGLNMMNRGNFVCFHGISCCAQTSEHKAGAYSNAVPMFKMWVEGRHLIQWFRHCCRSQHSMPECLDLSSHSALNPASC